MYEQESLAETIRRIIREELYSVEMISAKEQFEQPQAVDVDDNVLGFLRSLQEGV